MAYKFQIGAANLSGSITQTDGTLDARASTVDSLNVSNGGITNAGSIAGATTISGSGDLAMGTITSNIIQSNTDVNLTLRSDGYVDVVLDADNDGTSYFRVRGGDPDSNSFYVKEGGQVYIEGTLELGDTSDTTLARSSAGNLSVEGNLIYRAGGTDVPIADGGTGASNAATALTNLGAQPLDADLTNLAGCQAGASAALAALTSVEVQILSGATVSTAELNHLDGIADATYDQTGDSVVFFDATDSKLKYEAANDFVDAINGAGLDASSGTLVVSAAQTGITSVKNDGLVVGRTTGNDHIDFSAAGTVAIATNNVARVSVVDASTTISNNLVVSGDLTVNGTQTFVNTATLVVTSSIAFEGITPDPHEVILTAADATLSDKTVTLPNLTGHVPLLAGAVGNANVTSAEFLLLDGNSTVNTTTVGDGDAVLFNEAGVGMKHLNVTSLKTYFQTGVSADIATTVRHSISNITESSTISAVGMVICNLQPSTAGILTISGSFQSGDQILVKAGSNVDTTATLTVTGAAGYGYNFDGSQEVVLESPRAGFTLIYDGDAPNALWHIM